MRNPTPILVSTNTNTNATFTSKADTNDIEEPHNFSPSPDFKWLCDELFVKLDQIQFRPKELNGSKPKYIEYYDIINNFIDIWRRTVGNDIYPALILTIPYRDRRMYNIKESKLIRIVCDYLKLPKNSETERRLMRWKHRADRNVRLSTFCVEEIKKRKGEPREKIKITIDKLNECLDNLVLERGYKGSKSQKISESETFKFCFENMTYVELKYFFDILLKDKIVGGLEHKFLNCWHPDAQDYLSVVSDLKIVSSKLWNPEFRLKYDDLTINIDHAFTPETAKRLTYSYDTIARRLKNDFFIEEKMDGERIQLHYMNYGAKLKFLSRRGLDYSYLYGDNRNNGAIGRYLNFHKDVKECILDGEMVTYDSVKNCILPFGLVKSSAMQSLSVSDIEPDGYHPLYMAFDLVYLNGSSLSTLPLHQRKNYLDKLLIPCPDFVEILPALHCNDSSLIKSSLEKAIELGSEGIILKRFDSQYLVAKRSDDWIKIKPEYLEQFGENMDLIVIGRDPGKKDSLMCGLILTGDNEPEEITSLDSNPTDTAESFLKPDKRKIISFCNIANGISQKEFRDIDRYTFGHWIKFDDELPPQDLFEFGTKHPIEWIYPEHSVVLEIKARSLETNESARIKYGTGSTLFGGYCRQIRYDKDWVSCFTYNEFMESRNLKNALVNYPDNKNLIGRKKRPKKRMFNSLTEIFENTKDAPDESNVIFRGLHFYVISDYIDETDGSRLSKSDLCNLVLEHNGKLVHNPISRIDILNRLRIISMKYTRETTSLIERGYDIIHPQWILDCISNRKLVRLLPSHCFNVSSSLMEVTKTRVDRYGDSYETSLTEKDFEILINRQVLKSESADKRITEGENHLKIPILLFCNRRFFIPETLPSTPIYELKSKVELYGGKLVNKISDCNVIVFTNTHTENRKEVMKKIRRALVCLDPNSMQVPVLPRIVDANWIDACISECVQVPEEDYPAV
ncbi:hypothetical protein Kpol_1032p7 [Vanderwaltozyma polyspora DSM 70294]|uniref:DNA ligase n=1 Tax=Vanderwaltozyma polyspora (strain ATCC 22028 / DSM 70294 / BCRC 21397 / CBS 2163 / NBRC 10782 / NRRL Y-8283 / UCD 57-17) TaxID=436907 RepID=A7TGW3_VANPO|nr:uncharacterized protein Kpol_1032p7 [Vanderwaltozyma polyspora DSM 70294]EDO18415.1 hypothetical protein Kpol_1032p7 [Vanderwaltozyma polyspora DSM 70294]